MFNTNRAQAAELFSSGVCNIACNYCYIPKVDEMKNIHKEIIDRIQSGKYIADLKNLYGDQLSYLSFWGTEPTLTLSKIQTILPELFKEFPRLDSFGWSSNFITAPKVTIDFIKSLPKDKHLKISIQMSLDGPTEITDQNRAKGATKKIKDNLLAMISEFSTMDLGDLEISFGAKPTWDASNLEYYAEDISRLYGYFHFFDDLIVNAIQAASQKRNIKIHLSALPSLVVPGKYTTQDGKTLAKVFEYLTEIEKQNAARHIFRCIDADLNTYGYRLKRLFDYDRELHSKQNMFTCSGGDSNFALDEKSFVHICHRSFFLNNAKYLEDVMKTDIKKWGVSDFDEGSLKVVKDKFVVDSRDQHELNRFNYVNTHYHSYMRLKLNYSLAIIKELVDTHQINEVYSDPEFATLFALFINTAHSCPMENVLNTGIIHFSPISLFRMFGNGAFEHILKQLQEKYNERRRV